MPSEARLEGERGWCPATVKQAGRAADAIADPTALYIEKWAKPRKRSWKADDNLLRKKILPKWQHRRITEITRQDVALLVERVAEAGAPVVANRVAALLSKMFAFGLDRDLDWWDAKLIDILRNPQRGPAKVVSINARA